jgi:peroxiredoxin (alkyl hydroperoxide reductase subunit C)
MLGVGFAAPHFDCTAVVGGHVVRLRWEQAHDSRPRVLLFGSLGGAAGPSGPLVALATAAGLPRASVAVVCRDDLYDVLAWANRPPSEGGPGAVAFPLIADPAGRIAALYGLAAAGRRPMWGHFVIDSSDIIREAGVSDLPRWPGVEELLRSVRASGFPADKGLWN